MKTSRRRLLNDGCIRLLRVPVWIRAVRRCLGLVLVRRLLCTLSRYRVCSRVKPCGNRTLFLELIYLFVFPILTPDCVSAFPAILFHERLIGRAPP